MWSTALNAKVLNTILTTQQLLPLVTDFHSRILLLIPSVMSSLKAPNHAIESTVHSALEAFAASLASELRPLNVRLCHFKLGNIELPGSKQRGDAAISRVKGTSIRKLHESVFDALQAKRPRRTWYVGRGSLTYDFIGGWMPAGVVSWMMGLQKPREVPLEDTAEQFEGSDTSVQWEKLEQIA